MEYDDIIIGSGLAALATALGLAARRKVLVIGGPVEGTIHHYDDRRAAPNSAVQFGGLGQYWHGVIPTGPYRLADIRIEDFARLFAHFYPGSDISRHLGTTGYFVPWQAIRPSREWPRLKAERGDALMISHDLASRVDISDHGATVLTASGRHGARRAWIACGALHTPALLDASFSTRLSRGRASDHVICFLGQLRADRGMPVERPRPRYARSGFFVRADYTTDASALCMARPGRFSAKVLDQGIEKRFVFGLPTGSAVARLARAASPGLFAEAIYNKTGLFANAAVYNVYAQVNVDGAYDIGASPAALIPRREAIEGAIAKARAAQPYGASLIATERPAIYLPGIHLHDTLDHDRLAQSGFGTAASPLKIVDASIMSGIGPDHHSFRMMTAAFARAHAAD